MVYKCTSREMDLPIEETVKRVANATEVADVWQKNSAEEDCNKP